MMELVYSTLLHIISAIIRQEQGSCSIQIKREHFNTTFSPFPFLYVNPNKEEILDVQVKIMQEETIPTISMDSRFVVGRNGFWLPHYSVDFR